MAIFVVKGERAFYNDEIHHVIPDVAQEISSEIYDQLLRAQADCKGLDFEIYPPVIVERQAQWPTVPELQAAIDDKVAAIYAEWSRFEKELQSRESAARQLKDAGFEGEVSAWIKSYADPLGLSYVEAVDVILKQADDQRSTQEALASLRMRKYELGDLGDEARYKRYLSLVAEIDELIEPETSTPSQ